MYCKALKDCSLVSFGFEHTLCSYSINTISAIYHTQCMAFPSPIAVYYSCLSMNPEPYLLACACARSGDLGSKWRRQELYISLCLSTWRRQELYANAILSPNVKEEVLQMTGEDDADTSMELWPPTSTSTQPPLRLLMRCSSSN